MQTKHLRQKRIYLINRDFQLRYSLLAVFVGFVSTLLTTVLLLYPLYVFEILRIPKFLPAPVLLAIAVAAFANMFLIGLTSIFVTHRIAGPMYALVRSMRRVEMGGWAGHMKIRDSDDMRYVIRNFNHMVDGLVRQGSEDIKEIDAAIAMLDASPSNNDTTGVLLKDLRKKMEMRIVAALREGKSS